jgi:hypothetical protein
LIPDGGEVEDVTLTPGISIWRLYSPCDRFLWPQEKVITAVTRRHGIDGKTVQELLRHANSSGTLNLYAQAVTDIKRNAQSKVARLVFGKKAEAEK